MLAGDEREKKKKRKKRKGIGSGGYRVLEEGNRERNSSPKVGVRTSGQEFFR